MDDSRDVDGVVAEAARVLRPGGVLAVREIDPDTSKGRALRAVEHLLGFTSTSWPRQTWRTAWRTRG